MSSCRSIIAGWALVISSHSFAETVPNDTVNFVTGEWEPFISEQYPDYGCITKAVTQAYLIRGLSVEFHFRPWKRAYAESRKGKFDGVVYWHDSPVKRRQHIFPQQHLLIEHSHLYSLAERRLPFNSFEDLRHRRLIYNDGYTYTAEFWQQLANLDVRLIKTQTIEQNIKMLLAHRADYTIVSERAADWLLKDFGAGVTHMIRKSERPAASSQGFILFSRRTAYGQFIADEFDRGFRQLLADPQWRWHYEETCATL